MQAPQLHYRTCNICEAMCGIEIAYQGNEILSIKGDVNDPLSKGHICPKAVALQDFYEDPDRLRKPMRKTERGDWEEISWETAIDLVVTKFKAIQEEHGQDAVATYLGNPNAHNAGNTLFLPQLLKAINSKNRFSASSVDQLPHHIASHFMFGHGFLNPIPDIDRTDFFMLIGCNPMISNGSMMTVPNFPKRLKALQARGGKMVVIDPRKTETAQRADQHYFIKPETDALFLAALIYTIFEHKAVQLQHLESQLKGVQTLQEAIQPFSPERVASATGISAQDIRSIAQQIMEAPSAVVHSRMGASTQSFGGLCLWLTNALDIISGNLDRAGGAMFTQPAFDHVMASPKKGKRSSYGRYQSRVSGKPYYNSEFPVSILSEEIETPGEGQIKGLLVIAGNPVLSTPNGPRLDQALQQLSFLVSIDIYLTETNRHADVILPVATGLEASNYDIIFHSYAVRNTAKYSPALFPKKPEERYDWEVLKALTLKWLGVPDPGLTPDLILDQMLQMGRYAKEGLSLEKLKAHPHGIDLGPLQPCLLERLQTNDDQIDLAPGFYLSDLDRLEKAYLGAEAQSTSYPFALIGRRSFRHHNTWTHNAERLKRGRNQCTLLLHPEDADELQIQDGEQVQVTSQTGSVLIEAEVSDEIMPGVVSIPQGWGSRKKTGMKVAAAYGGVSINDLTDENRVDTLTGNAALNGIGVRVERVAGSG